MNKIACIYFEGNDTKVALFQKEKGKKIVLLKADSIDTSLAFSEEQKAAEKSNGSKTKEVINFVSEEQSAFSRNFLQKMNEFFFGEDVSKCRFIPILAEPALYFQKINDEKDLAHLNVNKKGKIETTIGYVKMFDDSRLAVYPSGKSNYLQALDALARINNRRFLRIPSVKSAEISLLNYVQRKKSYDLNEITLVLYVGKEYSKLIFLKGNKLYHVGSTLAVGKNSFNSHSVIVSKILLEMENSHITRMDNILVCGEDNSDDLITFLSEAYAGSKVSVLDIEEMEIGEIDSFYKSSAFVINAAVAEEYFQELEKKTSGINLLPEYVKEEQKMFSLHLPGYIMLFLILVSAAFFIYKINANREKILINDAEIRRFELLEVQNKEAVEKIKRYENKITNVDNTRAVLNQLSAGTGILSDELKRIAEFVNARRNFWISEFSMNEQKMVKIAGFTFSRVPVKQLADTYKNSILENIVYDPLRETRTFKFKIDAGTLSLGGTNEKKQ